MLVSPSSALFPQAAILTTMDITTDGFGFMLSVGDLTWVPFTYGLQARYLAFMPKDLGLLGTLGVLAVNAVGYYIFRTANGEKNDFRNGGNKKNLSFMTTQSGRKLLTSGWWGRSRHPNYLGDWIMAWAWCLPTAFDTPVTYFYVVFFAVLLVHRQMRDDEACTEKYGKDWASYVSANNGQWNRTDPWLMLLFSVQDGAFAHHSLRLLGPSAVPIPGLPLSSPLLSPSTFFGGRPM